MKISDLLSMCLRSLLRRKVRTLLTVIGVVIGTCAIVVTISLGEGMTQSQMAMLSQWTDLTTIEVYPDYWSEQGASTNAPELTDDMLQAMKSYEHVDAVSPSMDLYNELEIWCGNLKYQGSVRVIDLTMLEKMGYELKEGEFKEGDAKKLLYLGEQSMYNFFDPSSEQYPQYDYDEEGNIISPPPVNLADTFTFKVRVEGGDESGGVVYNGGAMGYFESVGGGENGLSPEEQQQLEEKRASATEGTLTPAGIIKGDYAKDNGNTFYSVYIDVSLAREIVAEYNKLNDIKPTKPDGTPANPNVVTYNNAVVKVDDMNNVDGVETQIKDLGFGTYSFESQRKPLEEQTRQIQFLFGGLGGISLLVAAIGIANTMVMSIYERTREIGVMKVLGCELRDIRMMFLTEAAMIGLLGGIIGIGISFGISAVINALQGQAETATSIIPVWLVLLGLGFSTLVGIISGFSPANRAVKISALSAIHQE